MKVLRTIGMSAMLMLAFAICANAQLTGIQNVPGSFATLQDAVTALNTQGVGAGGVTFNVTAAQTAPAGGYVIGGTGSAVLTTASSTQPITFTGNGNTVTASAAQTAGSLTDAIFKLIGADFVTIQGFIMQENAANTAFTAASNNATEFGVALFYATTTDGAQNNTISANTINMTRLYQNSFGVYSNNSTSSTSITTAANSTTAAGANSGTTITGNTLTDVNLPVVIVGSALAATPAAQNTNITVGGTAVAGGNTITDYGSTGTISGFANVSGTVNGILVRNSTTVNVNFNSVTSSAGGVTSGTLRGIYLVGANVQPTGTFTNSINNNTISLTTGVLAGGVTGIQVDSGTGTITSTTNINTNTFTTLTSSVAAASGTFTGITNSGSATAGPLVSSIDGNIFNSISSATTGGVTFISNTYTAPPNATKNVTNNVIANFNKTGAGGTVTGINDQGSSATANITDNYNNNTISGITLTGATAFTGIAQGDGGGPTKNVTGNTVSSVTGGTSSVLGITTGFDGGPTTVSLNNVNNLSGTGAGAVTGMSSATGAGVRIVSRNKIYNLSNSFAGSTFVAGMTISGGTDTRHENNLIGNLTASNGSNATAGADVIRGINITSTVTSSLVSLSFNTVYLSATSAGATFSTAALFHTASATATTANLRARNNIFVNLSIPGGTGETIAYRRSTTALNNYDAASNNNDFYAGTPSPTNLIFTDGTNDEQTLAGYKTRVTPRDSASISENPPFISTVGADATFLHINPAVATQLESGGVTIAGITVDFDGNVRNNPPDIGADEFTGTLLDLTGPSITFTPLTNTSSTANRTINVTITDMSGVAGGAFAPRLYFRKNGGAYVSTQCTGTAPNFVCTFDFSLVGGVTVNDTIDYFVVAQDTNGNLSASPSGGFTGNNVNDVTTPPTTPNTFKIVAQVSGAFNVGVGETYQTLTDTGGFFEFINNSEVVGAVTINITSDLTLETGLIALNTFVSPNTVTISPSGGVRTISGTLNSNALLRFNGASNVIIDGSMMGGTDRSLTITNLATTAPQVIRFGSVGTTPMTGNVLRNTNIINGANTSSAVVIGDVGGGAGYFNNITIQNNSIQRAFIGIFNNAIVTGTNGSGLLITENNLDTTGADAIRLVGIYLQGVNDGTVSNNLVGNFSDVEGENDMGIWLATGTSNTTVSGNSVTNLGMSLTTGFAPTGILDSGGAAVSGNNLTTNVVTDITTNGTTQVRGINISGAGGGTTVQRNDVQGVINLNTGTYGAYGIDVSATGVGVVLKNNFVSNISQDMSGGFAFDTTFSVFGIRIGAGTGHQVYHNSVNLYGLLPGTPNSNLLTKAFGIVATSSTGLDVRNNIFANNITGGTTNIAHVSIFLPSGGTSAMNLTLNNNAYFYGADATTQGVGQQGTTPGSPNLPTLAALRTYSATLSAAGTNDNASVATTDAPPFTSNTDLHIVPATGATPISIISNAGVSIPSVTNDFDNNARTSDTPDIGADEFTNTGGTLAAGSYGNITLDPGATTLGGIITVSGNFTVPCGSSIAGAGESAYVDGNVVKNYCAIGSFSYPVGTVGGAQDGYSPVTANITVLTINPSSLAVDAVDQTLPGLTVSNSASRHWLLTETGELTADPLSFTYRPDDLPTTANPNNFRVFRSIGGVLTNFCPDPTPPDPTVPCVSGRTATTQTPVTQFSPWGVGALVPTAASVDVGGRIREANGRGIFRARVTMTDSDGNTRLAYTNQMGYYRFAEVPAGETYIFSAAHRRYQFAQPNQIRVINSDADDVNFTAGGDSPEYRPEATFFDRAPFDFDGDGVTDVAVYRESNNTWYIKRSVDNTLFTQAFGTAGDRLVPADFDGDGAADIAVYRASEGVWYVRMSTTGELRVEQFGDAAGRAVAADFDGDGKADFSVWNEMRGTWQVKLNATGATLSEEFAIGKGNFTPIASDRDGDGKADFVLFNSLNGAWTIRTSAGASVKEQFGQPGDRAAMGDFDGDGRGDLAVFQSATGGWTIRSAGGKQWMADGLPTNSVEQTRPLVGDFDGDGKWDAATAAGDIWTIRQSASARIRQHQFGLADDAFIPAIQ